MLHEVIRQKPEKLELFHEQCNHPSSDLDSTVFETNHAKEYKEFFLDPTIQRFFVRFATTIGEADDPIKKADHASVRKAFNLSYHTG